MELIRGGLHEDYVAAGFFQEAEADLIRCLDIDPSYLLCASWLAKLEFYLGNKKQAFAMYSDLVTAGRLD